MDNHWTALRQPTSANRMPSPIYDASTKQRMPSPQLPRCRGPRYLEVVQAHYSAEVVNHRMSQLYDERAKKANSGRVLPKYIKWLNRTGGKEREKVTPRLKKTKLL
eukprot:7686833-Pyramimonas_sp.AAC.2